MQFKSSKICCIHIWFGIVGRLGNHLLRPDFRFVPKCVFPNLIAFYKKNGNSILNFIFFNLKLHYEVIDSLVVGL